MPGNRAWLQNERPIQEICADFLLFIAIPNDSDLSIFILFGNTNSNKLQGNGTFDFLF